MHLLRNALNPCHGNTQISDNNKNCIIAVCIYIHTNVAMRRHALRFGAPMQKVKRV